MMAGEHQNVKARCNGFSKGQPGIAEGSERPRGCDRSKTGHEPDYCDPVNEI
jgi:hypothetical protein